MCVSKTTKLKVYHHADLEVLMWTLEYVSGHERMDGHVDGCEKKQTIKIYDDV